MSGSFAPADRSLGWLVAERAGVGFEVAAEALSESLKPPSGRTVTLEFAGGTLRSTVSWDLASDCGSGQKGVNGFVRYF